METTTTVKIVPRKRIVDVSFNSENKLEEMITKLTKAENQLKCKENENLEVHKAHAVLQDRLMSSEKVQKKLKDENKRLKQELEITTSLNDIKCGGNCNESKIEYQILSNQLDLLEDDVSQLVRENKQMLAIINNLQKSLKEVSQSKTETQSKLDRADQQIYELNQLVLLLEYAAEDTSTQNLALQQTISQVIDQSQVELEDVKQRKIKSTTRISSNRRLRCKAKKSEENICSHNGNITDKFTEQNLKNINMNNGHKSGNNQHCAVYRGLFIRSSKFPCKCGTDFGTKQELKTHITIENGGPTDNKECGILFAHKAAMKTYVESCNKNVNSKPMYHKFV